MGGLPFPTAPAEIVKFFGDFKVSESDCIIEIKNGKMTGMGLVIMQSK